MKRFNDEANANSTQNNYITERYIASEKMRARNRLKYSQRFCESWLKVFSPWLSRCNGDADKPYCQACECRLDSNRCHLQRHERTTKHARNLIKMLKGENVKPIVSIRQERTKYFQQRQCESSPVKKEEDDSNFFEEDDNNNSNDISQDSENAFERGEEHDHVNEQSYKYDEVSELQMGNEELVLLDEKNGMSLVAVESSVESEEEVNGAIIYEKQ